jgi:hypothetical protein
VEQHQLRGGLSRSRKSSTASADAKLVHGGSGQNPISSLIDRLSRKGTAMKTDAAQTSNGKTDFEFRPTSTANNNSTGSPASARSTGGASNASGSQRSKSPSAIINRFTNFARGKYRNSLSEKTSNAVVADDRHRRVSINFCWV